MSDGEVFTACLIPRDSDHGSLDKLETYKWMERLRQDLTWAGGRKVDGWVFAGIHGEHSPETDRTKVHYHLIIRGRTMKAVIERLRDRGKYQLADISGAVPDDVRTPRSISGRSIGTSCVTRSAMHCRPGGHYAVEGGTRQASVLRALANASKVGVTRNGSSGWTGNHFIDCICCSTLRWDETAFAPSSPQKHVRQSEGLMSGEAIGDRERAGLCPGSTSFKRVYVDNTVIAPETLILSTEPLSIPAYTPLGHRLPVVRPRESGECGERTGGASTMAVWQTDDHSIGRRRDGCV